MNAVNTSAGTTRIPLIQTGQALQSLRDSGHSLPTAVGEPVDNSIEAGASNIAIRLDQSIDARGKSHVHRIIIADDGRGMDVDTLHHYLVLGYSTRYMRKDTIGKYGVGAKLAALNFGRRIDVWSRTSAEAPFLHVYFDLDEALRDEQAGDPVGVERPAATPPTEYLQDLLPAGSGTVVVWSRVDRLEEGRLAQNFNALRLELEAELSRMFRYFIQGGIKLRVNEKILIPHDPLMLIQDSWTDFVLNKHLFGKEGIKKPKHFPAQEIGKETIRIGGGAAEVTITLYPKEVVRKRGLGGDKLANELHVPDNLGMLSFVRRNREVSYTNVPRIFPSGVMDPDRFIGIEVKFDPDLDEYFGVRNVKRGVEPHGELRGFIRQILEKHIPTARKLIEDQWGVAARDEQENAGEHAAVVDAVKDINITMPQSRVESPTTQQDLLNDLEVLASDVGVSKEHRAAFIEQRKDLPFIVESVDFPGTMFIETKHVGGKVIIRLNTRHRFYRELWEPIRELSDREPATISGDEAVRTAKRTIEALTLLVIAYGKAESMHSNPVDQYGDLLGHWGQFLSTLLSKVKDVR